MAMREVSRIPKKDSRFNVNKIVDDISNFIEKKKIFDKEMEDNEEKRPDIDPYGEENWNNSKRDEVEKAKREESEFWGWMDDFKNN